MTFPHAPCVLLNLDVMDATGEQQVGLEHDIYKVRLDSRGSRIDTQRETQRGHQKAKALHSALNNTVDASYCGSCYGGTPPNPGSKCCNTCEDVRRAYTLVGWGFSNPDNFEQCVREHWKENIAKQAKEGCMMHGSLTVNKVAGNFHIMAGQSTLYNNMHIRALYSYMPKNYDFSHTINHLSFGNQYESMVNPLDGATKVAPLRDLRYQYFLKVVGTEINYTSKPKLITNQYSVTEHVKKMESMFMSGIDAGKTQYMLVGVYG
ncbi:ER-derived vesicles protein erv46 [Dimargaris verticillata]|uniref:ER-derived vesicles protein erv46 n=1 Tax=Dimargaris verticillata TaxID=2761393 RepID=A0A9W8AVM5_9FUNG|nr:ER-derived vesicles protein erv46 [Dimargaris verticillata]